MRLLPEPFGLDPLLLLFLLISRLFCTGCFVGRGCLEAAVDEATEDDLAGESEEELRLDGDDGSAGFLALLCLPPRPACSRPSDTALGCTPFAAASLLLNREASPSGPFRAAAAATEGSSPPPKSMTNVSAFSPAIAGSGSSSSSVSSLLPSLVMYLRPPPLPPAMASSNSPLEVTSSLHLLLLLFLLLPCLEVHCPIIIRHTPHPTEW